MKRKKLLLNCFIYLAYSLPVPAIDDLNVATLPKTVKNHKHTETVKTSFILPTMKTIPQGCFSMGSSIHEIYRNPDENKHTVCLSSFQISTHEITVAEFNRFIAATNYKTDAERHFRKNGCWSLNMNKAIWDWDWQKQATWQNPLKNPAGNSEPVTCVSFRDITHYIDWLNNASGLNFRLPTEAEWEYAARAGTKFLYYWGNYATKACRFANIADQTILNKFNNALLYDCDDQYLFSAPIKSFSPNRFGLYDMLGNAWEWTCSKYETEYTGAEKTCISTKKLADKDDIVVRGGGWNAGPDRTRSAYRNWEKPWMRMANWGFRLVITNTQDVK